jgi:hypothetical protein
MLVIVVLIKRTGAILGDPQGNIRRGRFASISSQISAIGKTTMNFRMPLGG